MTVAVAIIWLTGSIALAAVWALYRKAQKRREGHWSDCAIYNAPAYKPGECDCGGI